jgi:hypothetical protein
MQQRSRNRKSSAKERSSAALRFASFPRSIMKRSGGASRVAMNALRAPLTPLPTSRGDRALLRFSRFFPGSGVSVARNESGPLWRSSVGGKRGPEHRKISKKPAWKEKNALQQVPRYGYTVTAKVDQFFVATDIPEVMAPQKNRSTSAVSRSFGTMRKERPFVVRFERFSISLRKERPRE